MPRRASLGAIEVTIHIHMSSRWAAIMVHLESVCTKLANHQVVTNIAEVGWLEPELQLW